jgi:hypothetical protein
MHSRAQPWRRDQQSLGVDIGRLRLLVIWAWPTGVGGAVAVTGTISFSSHRT